jgi:hypothetical protein
MYLNQERTFSEILYSKKLSLEGVLRARNTPVVDEKLFVYPLIVEGWSTRKKIWP